MTEVLGESSLTILRPGPIDQATDPAGVPLLIRVRAGRNKDFDRLVFDFEGSVPGMRAEYVDQLVEDGSGHPITLRGRAVVQIVIRPAAAHRDDGTPTITGPPPDVTGFAAFRQVADAGDFEAVLTWGIGVAARTGLRGFTLTGPSRVAVDVVHAEPGTGDQLLRRGTSGAAVATWQWRLVQALGRELAVDEQFGPMTEQATRDFQRNNELAVDGIVGPHTRAAMVRALDL
jgi:peptidoglycan hydrolase-like protein with peptidoglycan-binding domain